jgi:hypothetical protein
MINDRRKCNQAMTRTIRSSRFEERGDFFGGGNLYVRSSSSPGLRPRQREIGRLLRAFSFETRLTLARVLGASDKDLVRTKLGRDQGSWKTSVVAIWPCTFSDHALELGSFAGIVPAGHFGIKTTEVWHFEHQPQQFGTSQRKTDPAALRPQGQLP